MADVDGNEGNPDPELGMGDASEDPTQFVQDDSTQQWAPEQHPEADDTSMMMDDIFRPSTDATDDVTVPMATNAVHEDIPVPVEAMSDEVPAVEAEVLEEPEPEPWWKSKWLIAVVAVLIGLAIGALVWGASRDQTAVKETPPLIATPQTTEPMTTAPGPTEVTVTETMNATATETTKIRTTATETAKVQVTSAETTKIKSTATETVKVDSTATETVKVPAEPAPTITLVVTESPVLQNTQGLTLKTATQACAAAAEEALKSTYPDGEVQVPRTEVLVAAIRADLDAWFIKVAATVDDTDRPVDCSVSGSEAAPSVDSVKLR